jgi:hypothetical protein
MTGYGDDDPEDGWDATDTVVVQLTNLILRARWIRDRLDAGPVADHAVRLVDDLNWIRNRVIVKDLGE